MRLSGILLIAASLFIAALANADDKDTNDDAIKKELAALEGTWELVGKEFLGKRSTKEQIEELNDDRVVLKGDRLTVRNEERKTVLSEAVIRINLKTKPKSVEVTYTAGLSKGETTPAIYEIEGDTLKVCYAMEKEKRPDEFAGKENGKSLLLTYKRVKK
jgi:uncharacterized protein (TIGR03067 family)